MNNKAKLQQHSKAQLSGMAKKLGISVEGKSKEQLIVAIDSATRNSSTKSSKQSSPKKMPSIKKQLSPASVKQKSPVPTSAKRTKNDSADKAKGKQAENTLAASKKKMNVAKTSANQGGSQAAGKHAAKKITANKSAINKQAAAKMTNRKAVAAASKLKTAASTSRHQLITSTGEKKNGSTSPIASAKPALGKSPTVGSAVVKSGAPTKQSSSKDLKSKPIAVAAKTSPKPPASSTSPKVLKKIREMQLQREANKDIGYRPSLIKPPGASDPVFDTAPQQDRIALFVRDPFWLHASWDITRSAVERSQAALAEQWYGAKPILRLIRIDDSGSNSEAVQMEIEIRGGVRNWYIPWTGAVANFRVSVGYLGSQGRFHVIATSNTVKTPAVSGPDAIDQHWTDLGADGEHIFALSGGYDTERDTKELQAVLEDRLQRSLGAPTLAKLGVASDAINNSRRGFHFDMDVELVVYGSTAPDAYLTLNEEPVSLRPDGTFVMRLPFPDRRQVIPAVSVARDGSHQRTIVVGVERNTKVMEPFEQEQDLGD